MALHEAATPRVLGFWAAVSIVMGNMIGSGVFLLPASLAAYRGLSLAGWLISAAGSVMLALVFARLARQWPATGGMYAYTRAAFGDVAGFLVAWGYWLSTVGTLGALAVAFVGYLDPFMPGIVRAPGSAAALAIVMIWMFVGVNIAGVGVAGRVQIATTALKMLPLVVVGGRRRVLLPARRVCAAADGPDPCGGAAGDGRHADAVGVSRPRVRDDSGRERPQSRADDSAGDDRRHDADRGRLHRLDDRRDEPGGAGRAGHVDGAVCRRRAPADRRPRGAARRAWRGRLLCRRAQRVGPDRRATADGGGGRRPAFRPCSASCRARARRRGA